MGAETEWWEDAAPEIDFMPESDAAPRKGIRVRVSVCVCEREFSVNTKGYTIVK